MKPGGVGAERVEGEQRLLGRVLFLEAFVNHRGGTLHPESDVGVHDFFFDGFMDGHQSQKLLERLASGARCGLCDRGAEFAKPSVLVQQQINYVAAAGCAVLAHVVGPPVKVNA